jgi:hypothetical protein
MECPIVEQFPAHHSSLLLLLLFPAVQCLPVEFRRSLAESIQRVWGQLFGLGQGKCKWLTFAPFHPINQQMAKAAKTLNRWGSIIKLANFVEYVDRNFDLILDIMALMEIKHVF